jgi:hypothetical protein
MKAFSSDPDGPGRKAEGGKPRIWAEGSQRPAFDWRAYLRVSLNRSRQLAVPALGAMALRLDALGQRVEQGGLRVPPARLGRTGRYLPSHVTTGRRLQDGAALARLAAEAARAAPPVEPMAFRGWAEPPAPPARRAIESAAESAPAAVPAAVPAERPPVERPRRAAPLPAARSDAGVDRDTLEAIRMLMAQASVDPVRPTRAPKAPPPPPSGAMALPELAPAEPAPRSGLFKLAARGLGATAVALAFPIGMGLAGLAVARGEDLRLQA